LNSTEVDLSGYEFAGTVVANFVATTSGKFTDTNCSSRGLSNAIDKQVLKHLRNSTAAVLVGGATARREGYKPDSRFVTFVLSNQTSAYAGLEMLTCENEEKLRDTVLGIQHRYSGLLVEAGPSLVAKLAELGLIDYLCLTIIGESEGQDAHANGSNLLLELFNISNAKLISEQSIEDTRLTIWRL
jgi:riboflavin biosynthesis pyrimidine reductase